MRQKRLIATQVQEILRGTKHPELPEDGEVQFNLHVNGAKPWSWASIRNNDAVTDPGMNTHNERQDGQSGDD